MLYLRKVLSNWKLAYTDGSSENIIPKIQRLPQHDQNATNTWSMMSKADQKPIADAINNVKRIEGLIHDDNMAMPVTPLAKDKWMNVGLRKAIAMAIDAGQTRVEWTTAADQVKQWGKGDKDENFEEKLMAAAPAIPAAQVANDKEDNS